MTCRDVMTRNPTCCSPSDTVEKVAQIMKSKDIGPVPIAEDGQLVGIVTDRDLAINVVAEGRDPRQTTAEEIMARNVITCEADDDIQSALEAMAQHQVRRIPVVDDDGRIIGVIAQADIATRARQPEKTAAVVQEISKPRGAKRRAA